MNLDLRRAKQTAREIEKFCNSRPLPSMEDVRFYIRERKLEEFLNFATATITAVWEMEEIFHGKKINQYREIGK